MSFLQRALGLSTVLSLLGGGYAKLDLESNSNVVVYWGQNSLGKEGDQGQQRLSHYCEDPDIGVIALAFLMKVNGPGGAPEFDFASASDECTVINGTNLQNCPQMEEDITTCQKNDKTILLSIGGATYSEGGFDSEDDAIAGAELVWKTFGPSEGHGSDQPAPDQSLPDQPLTIAADNPPSTAEVHDPPSTETHATGIVATTQTATTQKPVAESTDQPDPGKKLLKPIADLKPELTRRTKHGSNSTVHRPFGKSSVDGFDLDFESANTNMSPFAKHLRKLMDAEKSKKFYLTAAPQCPYPDAADKPFLNGPGPAYMDAVWVQFYNNPCGVDGFKDGTKEQKIFNFDSWDNWAKNGSVNKNVKVILGVPGNTGGANSGYLPASKLEPVIEYSKKFNSFGGVMIWDVTQAYGNKGFISDIRQALKRTSSRVLRYAFRRDNA